MDESFNDKNLCVNDIEKIIVLLFPKAESNARERSLPRVLVGRLDLMAVQQISTTYRCKYIAPN